MGFLWCGRWIKVVVSNSLGSKVLDKAFVLEPLCASVALNPTEERLD